MQLVQVPCKQCGKFSYCQEYEKENRHHVNKKGVWEDCMSPIRKCQYALCEKHLSALKMGTVLEVGCGSSRKGGFIRKLVEASGNRWIGMDIVETDQTSYVCDVSAMPFSQDSFDMVIGNQTMEHWDRPIAALMEIYRVLKPGGLIHLNVPIHLHGTRAFVEGDFAAIAIYFSAAGLTLEQVETWRQEPAPLDNYLPDESKTHFAKYGLPKTHAGSAYIALFIARKPMKMKPEPEKVLKQYLTAPNDLYNHRFFAKRTTKTRSWEMQLGKWLVTQLGVRSVVDFGCGVGSYLEGAYKAGAKPVLGFEYAYESAKPFLPPHLADMIKYGNAGERIDCGTFDMAMSIEVAEHILPEQSEAFVDNLSRAAEKWIFLTAAPPSQPGYYHLNCQPYEFWIDLLAKRGWKMREDINELARKDWPVVTNTPPHILKNLMFFSK